MQLPPVAKSQVTVPVPGFLGVAVIVPKVVEVIAAALVIVPPHAPPVPVGGVATGVLPIEISVKALLA